MGGLLSNTEAEWTLSKCIENFVQQKNANTIQIQHLRKIPITANKQAQIA